MTEAEQEAENAGYDAGMYGTNPNNRHFHFFATRQLTASWERGKAKAEKEKEG